MLKDQTSEFHALHVKRAKDSLLEQGDFYHEITFAKDGHEQALVIIPRGPTRATQAAAQAIADSDEADMISGAIMAWIESVSRHEDYKLGDVGRSPTRTELLMVVTADREGNRFTSVSEVLREAGKVRLEERRVELPPGMIVPELKPPSVRS
jgi:hypothetical protein